jgi:hypothetical protein
MLIHQNIINTETIQPKTLKISKVNDHKNGIAVLTLFGLFSCGTKTIIKHTAINVNIAILNNPISPLSCHELSLLLVLYSSI